MKMVQTPGSPVKLWFRLILGRKAGSFHQGTRQALRLGAGEGDVLAAGFLLTALERGGSAAAAPRLLGQMERRKVRELKSGRERGGEVGWWDGRVGGVLVSLFFWPALWFNFG